MLQISAKEPKKVSMNFEFGVDTFRTPRNPLKRCFLQKSEENEKPDFIENQAFTFICLVTQRRKRDSNPRSGRPDNGFQDRRIRPLCHFSAAKVDYFLKSQNISFQFTEISLLAFCTHSATRDSRFYPQNRLLY